MIGYVLSGNAKKSVFFMFRLITLLIMLSVFTFVLVADARVYIDITSPMFKQLPMAVYELVGAEEGKEISNTIRDDLQFSGLFLYVERDAYIETPLPVFNPVNWTPLGVELVLKGSVEARGDDIEVTVILYDVIDAERIMQKQYTANRRHLRPLSHTISNDIYRKITGEEGVFTTKIAFIGERDGKRNMFIMDWDGHRVMETGIRSGHLLTPHWASDGSGLLYSSERGGQWGIFLLDFKMRTEKMLLRSGGTNIAGDFLPDNSSFLYSSSVRGTPDIYIYSMKDSRIRQITNWRGIEISPSSSPDGERIAFVSDHGGSPQVYTMNVDGSDLRRVTFSGNYNTSPVWSPRGDRIAFSGRVDGKNQVFTVKPDGTEPVQLTSAGNNEEPSFSPDGRYITFTSDRDGIKAVYIMRANGDGQKRVTPRNMRAFGPRWSPNKIF